ERFADLTDAVCLLPVVYCVLKVEPSRLHMTYDPYRSLRDDRHNSRLFSADLKERPVTLYSKKLTQ
ncbi:hypothetical protein DPMN_013210, partial [Dreissena polymorpha]